MSAQLGPETSIAPDAQVAEGWLDTADLEPAVNAIITESKAGYKTTEFWVSVVVSLLTLLGTVPVPEKFKGVIIGAVAVAYALSRGFAKQGIPSVTPVAADEAAVITTESA